jgi:hypothetical protein
VFWILGALVVLALSFRDWYRKPACELQTSTRLGLVSVAYWVVASSFLAVGAYEIVPNRPVWAIWIFLPISFLATILVMNLLLRLAWKIRS